MNYNEVHGLAPIQRDYHGSCSTSVDRRLASIYCLVREIDYMPDGSLARWTSLRASLETTAGIFCRSRLATAPNLSSSIVFYPADQKVSRRDRSPIRIGPATLGRPDPQAFGESSARSTAVFRFKRNISPGELCLNGDRVCIKRQSRGGSSLL